MTEVALTNGHHLNGNHADYEMDNETPGANVRFTSGLILPPPEIKGKSCIMNSRIYLS